MPKPYEFFDHTADIGVHIYGATLPELFSNAAPAMYEVLGKLEMTGVRTQKSMELRAESMEDLLHDWLAELLYEVEANHVLFDEIASLTVCGSAVPGAKGAVNRGEDVVPTFELHATLRGGTIDFSHSQTNEEIKAVTYHQLHVEQTADGQWRAKVIFDV
ncbi:MAG: archease [Verrucomicrobiia bacterium]|jgi:SHS2 domain-containing protein